MRRSIPDLHHTYKRHQSQSREGDFLVNQPLTPEAEVSLLILREPRIREENLQELHRKYWRLIDVQRKH